MLDKSPRNGGSLICSSDFERLDRPFTLTLTTKLHLHNKSYQNLILNPKTIFNWRSSRIFYSFPFCDLQIWRLFKKFFQYHGVGGSSFFFFFNSNNWRLMTCVYYFRQQKDIQYVLKSLKSKNQPDVHPGFLCLKWLFIGDKTYLHNTTSKALLCKRSMWRLLDIIFFKNIPCASDLISNLHFSGPSM